MKYTQSVWCVRVCRCKSCSPSESLSLLRHRICEYLDVDVIAFISHNLCACIRMKRPVSFTNDSHTHKHTIPVCIFFCVNGLSFGVVSRPFGLVLNFLDLFYRKRKKEENFSASVTMLHVCVCGARVCMTLISLKSIEHCCSAFAP